MLSHFADLLNIKIRDNCVNVSCTTLTVSNPGTAGIKKHSEIVLPGQIQPYPQKAIS